MKIIENRFLNSEEDIEDYFVDEGREFFDCGQGYYEEDTNVVCKIGDKFYEVHLEAEIESSKQDYGDRLYRVSEVSVRRYFEISDPNENLMKITYEITLNSEQKETIESYMKANKIPFIIK